MLTGQLPLVDRFRVGLAASATLRPSGQLGPSSGHGAVLGWPRLCTACATTVVRPSTQALNWTHSTRFGVQRGVEASTLAQLAWVVHGWCYHGGFMPRPEWPVRLAPHRSDVVDTLTPRHKRRAPQSVGWLVPHGGAHDPRDPWRAGSVSRSRRRGRSVYRSLGCGRGLWSWGPADDVAAQHRSRLPGPQLDRLPVRLHAPALWPSYGGAEGPSKLPSEAIIAAP